MSNQPDDVNELADPSTEWSTLAKLSDPQPLFDSVGKHYRQMLVRRFGDEILAVSLDDSAVLACVESAQPERQMMGLHALLQLRYVCYPRIVQFCVDYTESGPDAYIKSLCVLYLGFTVARGQNDGIIEFLRSRARCLSDSAKTKDNEFMLGCIERTLAYISQCRQEMDESDKQERAGQP
jgi:hypothetical protein